MKRIKLKSGHRILVSEGDYHKVSQYKWWKDYHGYAIRTKYVGGKRKVILMHRELLGAVDGQLVDHVNGDRLDNRRSNLRIVTRGQNRQNSRSHCNPTGFKGVSLIPVRWMARIRVQGTLKNLGYYKDPESAAKAYDKAARKYFGVYACTNFKV